MLEREQQGVLAFLLLVRPGEGLEGETLSQIRWMEEGLSVDLY